MISFKVWIDQSFIFLEQEWTHLGAFTRNFLRRCYILQFKSPFDQFLTCPTDLFWVVSQSLIGCFSCHNYFCFGLLGKLLYYGEVSWLREYSQFQWFDLSTTRRQIITGASSPSIFSFIAKVQLIHESFLITYLNSDSTYLFITVARNLVNRSTAWFYEILMSCTNKKSRNTSRQHSGNSTCFLFLTYACAWNQLIYTVNAQADHNI